MTGLDHSSGTAMYFGFRSSSVRQMLNMSRECIPVSCGCCHSGHVSRHPCANPMPISCAGRRARLPGGVSRGGTAWGAMRLLRLIPRVPPEAAYGKAGRASESNVASIEVVARSSAISPVPGAVLATPDI
eukprot:2362601-Amphidinium_carterae.2